MQGEKSFGGLSLHDLTQARANPYQQVTLFLDWLRSPVTKFIILFTIPFYADTKIRPTTILTCLDYETLFTLVCLQTHIFSITFSFLFKGIQSRTAYNDLISYVL